MRTVLTATAAVNAPKKPWTPAPPQKNTKTKKVGDLVFAPDGLAKRGLLLRHLVMPGQGGEARAILEWVAAKLGADTFVNLMEQVCVCARGVGVGVGGWVGGGGKAASAFWGGGGDCSRRAPSLTPTHHPNTRPSYPLTKYHANHLVGKGELRSRGGFTLYDEIGARPPTSDVEALRAYARSLGLWRFDEAPRYEAGGGTARAPDELAA